MTGADFPPQLFQLVLSCLVVGGKDGGSRESWFDQWSLLCIGLGLTELSFLYKNFKLSATSSFRKRLKYQYGFGFLEFEKKNALHQKIYKFAEFGRGSDRWRQWWLMTHRVSFFLIFCGKLNEKKIMKIWQKAGFPSSFRNICIMLCVRVRSNGLAIQSPFPAGIATIMSWVE